MGYTVEQKQLENQDIIYIVDGKKTCYSILELIGWLEYLNDQYNLKIKSPKETIDEAKSRRTRKNSKGNAGTD